MTRARPYGDRRPGRDVGGFMWRRQPSGSWVTNAKGRSFSPSPDCDVTCGEDFEAELLPVRNGSGSMLWALTIRGELIGGSWPMPSLRRATIEGGTALRRAVLAVLIRGACP